MNFTEYQMKSNMTAIYPDGKALEYLCLGLASEAGEVAGKLKKIIRDNNSEITDESRFSLSSELGDVLWYISQLALELNIPLDVVAHENIIKLQSRMDRGKISGSGDVR